MLIVCLAHYMLATGIHNGHRILPGDIPKRFMTLGKLLDPHGPQLSHL